VIFGETFLGFRSFIGPSGLRGIIGRNTKVAQATAPLAQLIGQSAQKDFTAKSADCRNFLPSNSSGTFRGFSKCVARNAQLFAQTSDNNLVEEEMRAEWKPNWERKKRR